MDKKPCTQCTHSEQAEGLAPFLYCTNELCYDTHGQAVGVTCEHARSEHGACSNGQHFSSGSIELPMTGASFVGDVA